jgi:hypothetical protein
LAEMFNFSEQPLDLRGRGVGTAILPRHGGESSAGGEQPGEAIVCYVNQRNRYVD